jgi:hypothetical protein
MPTNTFENLSTVTVSGTSTSTITFTGINTSTYRNFLLIGWIGMNASADTLVYQVNSDTSNHITSWMYGVGTANAQIPISGLQTNYSGIRLTDTSTPAQASYGTAFRITIANPRTGAVNSFSDALTAPSGEKPYFNVGQGAYIGTMTSLRITGLSGNIMRPGSVVSLYGVI